MSRLSTDATLRLGQVIYEVVGTEVKPFAARSTTEAQCWGDERTSVSVSEFDQRMFFVDESSALSFLYDMKRSLAIAAQQEADAIHSAIAQRRESPAAPSKSSSALAISRPIARSAAEDVKDGSNPIARRKILSPIGRGSISSSAIRKAVTRVAKARESGVPDLKVGDSVSVQVKIARDDGNSFQVFAGTVVSLSANGVVKIKVRRRRVGGQVKLSFLSERLHTAAGRKERRRK